MKYLYDLKQLTGIVISDVHGGIRQIRPSILFLFILTFLLFLGTVYSMWFLFDYQTTRTRIPDLVRLSKEHNQRDKIFREMSKQIDQITQEMNMIEENPPKIKTTVIPGIKIGNPRGSYPPARLTGDRDGTREI